MFGAVQYPIWFDSAGSESAVRVSPDAGPVHWSSGVAGAGDRTHLRPFFGGHHKAGSLALAGYAVLFATPTPGAGNAGTMVAAYGLFPAVVLALAWAGGNAGGDVKKAVVITMVIGVGNLEGVASSFIYRPQDSPRYHPGHATAISCLCVAIVLCIVAMLEFARLNRKKDGMGDIMKEGFKGEFEEMGDESPLFSIK